MAVKLVKYYKWFQINNVDIPSYNEHDGTDVNQLIEPGRGYGWRHTSLNESYGFKTIEEAERALEKWAQNHSGMWEEYILQTCYKPETD